MTGTTVSHYRVEDRLGKGGMGVVYRAVDTRLGRTVALKFLHDEQTPTAEVLARFQREARAISALNHPNICTLHDIGEYNGQPYLVIEYLEGATAGERLNQKPFTIDEVIDAGIQIADALDAAHSQGLIHRDIKPANVFMTQRGQAKVLDFGLAKIHDHRPAPAAIDPGCETLTMAQDLTRSRIAGTLPYMSPEQLRGEDADARSDVFSLGATLYEMATGKRAFPGATHTEVSAAILERQPVAPRSLRADLPAALNDVILTALSKDRQTRYKSAAELRTALQGIRHKSQPFIPARILRLAAVALALGAVVAGVLFYQSWRLSKLPRFRHMEISRLTASGNAITAAISPDGRYLAYVASQEGKQSFRIKQVVSNSEVQVSPPTEANYRGLVFTPDGNSLYYLNGVAALFSIPTLGGTPTRLNGNVDSTVAFSPDGKQIAFARYYPRTSESTIQVAQADGTGERKIASRVSPEGFNAAVAWSPDGKTIVCAPGGYGGGEKYARIATISPSGGPLKILADRKWFTIRELKWLPHGRGFVVLGIERVWAPAQFWYASYPSGALERITNDLNDYTSVSITGDSASLATVQLQRTSVLSLADARGESTPVPLTSMGPGLDGLNGLGWTMDGRIVYSSTATGRSDVWITSLQAGTARQLTSAGDGAYPRVSPDGRYIVYTALGQPTGPHIWRMNLDGSGAIQLTTGEGEITSDCCLDGKWVIFWPFAPRDGRMWRVPIGGGAAEPGIEMRTHLPIIAPDSKQVAFNYFGSRDRPQRGVAVLSTRDNSVKRFDIRNSDRNDPWHGYRRMGWTADSKGVLFLRETAGVSNIWIQPVDGRPQEQFTRFRDGYIFNFALSPDGKRLALVHGRMGSDVILVRNVVE